jgi:signal transduction histidine kinase
MAASEAAGPEGTAAACPPRPSVMWSIALVGCVASVVSVSLDATVDPASGAIDGETGNPRVLALLFGWLTFTYVGCGLIAWWHRPASHFGPLMIVVGFTIFVTGLSRATHDALFTIGNAVHLLPPVLFAQLFLAFPTGRLRTRLQRVMIVVACATALGLGLLRMSLGGLGPHNLLEVVDEPGAASAVLRVQLVVIIATCLIALAVLVARRRGAGSPLRRSLNVLITSFAGGLIMIGLLLASIVVGAPAVQQIRWATFATLGVAPVAFLVGILRNRLARSAVAELVIELRQDPAPVDLRNGLARALRDPSLSVAYWLPDFARYVDSDGQPVDLPTSGSTRATTLIDHDGAHVAVLLHDPALEDEPALLDAVAAAAGIALENGRLHADLRARLDELRGSRARIVDAGQQERKRLERDLHDGAQQRLVALSLELSLLGGTLQADPAARRRIDHARGEIATSLEELRDIARGLHPAVVSGHGLEVALEQLAARAPVPVRLDVDVTHRLPERLEVAAFYLVAESLANIGKHAAAASATITVTRIGDQVVVEVADDGIGGADAARGSGLRGLADRVEALEGRLRVWSPVGGGTRLRAELPCVS